MKTPMMESYFNKAIGLQEQLYQETTSSQMFEWEIGELLQSSYLVEHL